MKLFLLTQIIVVFILYLLLLLTLTVVLSLYFLYLLAVEELSTSPIPSISDSGMLVSGRCNECCMYKSL